MNLLQVNRTANQIGQEKYFWCNKFMKDFNYIPNEVNNKFIIYLILVLLLIF